MSHRKSNLPGVVKNQFEMQMNLEKVKAKQGSGGTDGIVSDNQQQQQIQFGILVKKEDGEEQFFRHRKDQYGNKIIQNSKKHKISFKDDKYDEQLVEVIEVVSYKEYNKENKGEPSCCIIF